MTVRTRLQQARPGVFRGFWAHDAAGAAHDPPHLLVLRSTLAMRFVLSALLGLAMFVSVRVAQADDLSQFELGKTRFDGGEYDQAAQRFAGMLDSSQPTCSSNPTNVTSACRLTDAEVIERARAYYAASLIALDRNDEADAQITEILSRNLQFSPDPAVFPQKVVDRFTAVRAKRRQELEAAEELRRQQERERTAAAIRAKEAEERWLQALRQQAAEERVVIKNSRFVAALPFGIGQFQNGNRPLGWTFAISQGVLAATSIITKQTYDYFRSFDQRKANDEERQLLYTNQVASLRINQATFGVFAALAIAGIVQAQVSFIPEKVVLRRRDIPPRPTTSLPIVPSLSLSSGTFSVGVSGVF